MGTDRYGQKLRERTMAVSLAETGGIRMSSPPSSGAEETREEIMPEPAGSRTVEEAEILRAVWGDAVRAEAGRFQSC